MSTTTPGANGTSVGTNRIAAYQDDFEFEVVNRIAKYYEPDLPTPHDVKAFRRSGGLPPRSVRVDHDETRVLDRAISNLALNDHDLYQVDGELVRVVVDNERRPKITPLSKTEIRVRLAATSYFFKLNSRDVSVRCVPPSYVIEAIYSAKLYDDFRPLKAVRTRPFLLSDGSIVSNRENNYLGWNGASETLILDESKTEIDPNGDEIEAAKQLLELVDDFPFETPADKSAWLALVLTLAGRTAIDGCSPIFAIDANTAGTGKGLLLDVASIIGTGAPAPKGVSAGDNSETRKVITSQLLAGRELITIDNIDEPFGGSAIDAAITAEVWTDRVLRESKIVDLPNRATWCLTGNNLRFKGDTPRRVLRIRMATDLERPEERDNFRRRNLLGHVRANRHRLYKAAVTILHAWLRYGDPTIAEEIPTWGSFEDWSRVIRGAIVSLEMPELPDPIQTRERLALAKR